MDAFLSFIPLQEQFSKIVYLENNTVSTGISKNWKGKPFAVEIKNKMWLQAIRIL